MGIFNGISRAIPEWVSVGISGIFLKEPLEKNMKRIFETFAGGIPVENFEWIPGDISEKFSRRSEFHREPIHW